MLDTLYGKTFLILGSQLGVTWITTIILISAFRKLYYSKVDWISGSIDERGKLDLDLCWETIKPYFWALLAIDIGVFFVLLFLGLPNLLLGMPLFTLWSILTGIELSLCLISVDENLGAKVLALTALITCAAGLVGARSGIEFSFLSAGLFWALHLLIAFGLVQILISIPRWIQRLWALFGTVVFTGYLLYDFHRLSLLNEYANGNTWAVAMRVSISIYLDIINLFLKLLDLLSR